MPIWGLEWQYNKFLDGEGYLGQSIFDRMNPMTCASSRFRRQNPHHRTRTPKARWFRFVFSIRSIPLRSLGFRILTMVPSCELWSILDLLFGLGLKVTQSRICCAGNQVFDRELDFLRLNCDTDLLGMESPFPVSFFFPVVHMKKLLIEAELGIVGMIVTILDKKKWWWGTSLYVILME